MLPNFPSIAILSAKHGKCSYNFPPIDEKEMISWKQTEFKPDPNLKQMDPIRPTFARVYSVAPPHYNKSAPPWSFMPR